jgi:hypothetical protein
MAVRSRSVPERGGPPSRPAFRSVDSYRTRARARIYLKDPLALSKRGSLPVGFAIVGGDTSIAPGPTSSRLMVVDYDSSTDRVYAPTRPLAARLVQWTAGRGERLIDFQAPRGTRGEAQINAWATAVDTLELFQQPIALGREVPWAFDASRLRILPQAMYEANAYYSRQTRALHFGHFHDRRGRHVKTALSHDIVAHETAHAVLDGLRPFYLEAAHPDAAGFHEYTGDLAAMLSLFRQREFIGQLVEVPHAQPSFFDLVTDLAPEVGQGVYGDADRSFLRTARNQKTYRDVLEERDPHVRCQVLTGFAFDVFREIFTIRSRTPETAREQAPNQTFANLVTTARHVVQMLLRPLDLLPPGEITFPEYASILLRIDRHFYPDDRLRYRAAVERMLRKRGLHPEASYYEWETTAAMPEDRRLRERDIGMIRSSRVGAYRFLDANRRAFGLAPKRDFRVVGLATNRRELNRGYLPPPETIIQYAWEELVPLPRDVRTTALEQVVVRAGGTVVIDENVNLIHWSPQAVTPARREAAQRHVAGLLEDRAIDLAPVRGVHSMRPVIAARDDTGAVRLVVNTARMHHGRGQV